MFIDEKTFESNGLRLYASWFVELGVRSFRLILLAVLFPITSSLVLHKLGRSGDSNIPWSGERQTSVVSQPSCHAAPLLTGELMSARS